MKKYIIVFIALLFVNIKVCAQVTIGSDLDAVGGALLQVKEYESTDTDLSTGSRGFSNTRVALTKNDELYPMYPMGYPGVADIAAEKRNHIGMVVYNITTNTVETPTSDIFVPGLYMWSGDNWTLIESGRVAAPSVVDFDCGAATLTPATYEAGVPYTGILRVPYIGGNGGNYSYGYTSVSAGLFFRLQPGRLNVGNGDTYYTVEGVPTVTSPVAIPHAIKLFGKTCVTYVGNEQDVRAISFTKTKAEDFTNDNISEKTVTSLGNLSVRVEYLQVSGFPGFNWSYFLAYKVDVPTHVSVLYTKSGRSVGYVVTGKKAAIDTSRWYRAKTGAFNDGSLIFDSSAFDGPTGSKDDLNPPNRDVIQTIFMLHNTNEVYRVTINANGLINQTGLIAAVPPTITIFLEKLD